jgi:hypothetical protein
MRIFIAAALAAAALLAVPVLALADEPGVVATVDPSDLVAILTLLLGAYAKPVGLIALGLIGLAKIVCATTGTPDPSTTWGKVYPWIEKAALIFGRMKDTAGAVLAIVVTGLVLTACVTKPTGDLVGDLRTNHAKFLEDVKGLNEGAVVALRNVDEDLGALRPALAQVCGAIAYNDGLFKLVAPLAGADPTALGVEATVMVGANLACAATGDPNAPRPTVADALVKAAQIYLAVQGNIAKVSPETAAAVAPKAAS